MKHLLSRSPHGKYPVVVTDGFCPACGRPAPLRDYWQLARSRDGLLVIDDTQALGILGRDPSGSAPYGIGGGGSLQAAALQGKEGIVMISSLAKAFGAPVAVFAGPKSLVHQFRTSSETRVHCSPPSAAAVSAAAAAIVWNQARGEAPRRRLSSLVLQLRIGLMQLTRKPALGGLFPVQSFTGPQVPWLHRRLWRRGVRTVLHASEQRQSQPALSFLVTTQHSPVLVEEALALFAAAKEVPCHA